MKFRRRKYITDTKLQMKFTLLFVLVSFAASVISVAVFNFLAVNKMEALMWSTHLDIKSTGEIISSLFSSVNIGNFIFISILLLITGIWMMKKTSGPLYRMSRDINRIADADLSINIRLRQKDEFQETADELNKMTGSIREGIEIINEKYGDVSKAVRGLEAGGGKEENCEVVLKNIEGVKRETGRFKV